MGSAHYRILAIDVDGTLLDPSGVVRPRTLAALANAARAGMAPVLCTGRRYRRALPIARELGLDAPLVCNSGAIVKDPKTHKTLWRADLSADSLEKIREVFQARDEPIVVFADQDPGSFDFLIIKDPSGRTLFDEYVARNRTYAKIEPTLLEDLSKLEAFHVCAIGTREDMLAFEEDVHVQVKSHVRTFVQKSPQYKGTMCEILHSDAGKWSALLHLADLWDVEPNEICAIGDDMNDLPMIQGAGLGVAMAHAPEEVRRAADRVTHCNDQDGLAALVEELLS